MSDNRLFDIPKCKVTYVEKLDVAPMFTPPGLYTGRRYRVLLVDGGIEYWAGDYPVAEFATAVSTAHRIAKRAQTTRYNDVASLLETMKPPRSK